MDFEDWVEEFQSEMMQETKNSVFEWAKIVRTMGLNKEQRDKWSTIFKQNAQQIYADMIQDVKSKQIKIIEEIEGFLKEVNDICNILQEPIPQYGEKESDLFTERQILRQNLEQFNLRLNERKSKVKILRDMEIEICHTLGQKCLIYDDEMLLKKDEFEKYSKHLEDLEMTKFTRMEIFYQTREKIINFAKELKYKPQNDFEVTLLQNEDTISLKDDFMKKLEKFYNFLVDIKSELPDMINDVRKQVQDLATILDEDVSKMNNLLAKCNSPTFECLDVLKAELNRLKKLKLLNIQTFIQKLRVEIEEWWNKCHYSYEQRQEFQYMFNDCFTEELLTIHDIELNKLKKFYTDNQNLFNLLDKRTELWKRLQCLENNQKADRLKNRAGQLLQEEKERNKISINIPKVENQLRELAKKYEDDHEGCCFLSFGLKIEDIIVQSHEERDNKKKLRVAKRKVEGLSPTNKKTLEKLSVYNPQPCTSAIKNTPSAKKRKMVNSRENGSNKVMTAPSRIGYSVNKRLSDERSKRMKKVRRMLRESQNRLLVDCDLPETLSSYDDFQENIPGNSRSTMHIPETSPLAIPLPVTPTLPRKLTPARLGSKSPNTKSKLTSSSLKLLF